MKNKDYSIELIVDAPIKDVFRNINNVAAWWTDDLKGSTEKRNDVFTVQFEDMHTSTQKIVECIPDQKIVWLVTDSHLSFLKNKSEWTNTEIHFELSRTNNKTHVLFTHIGLNPSIECYKDCTKGWDYYIKGSLYKFITQGKGTPGL